MKTTHAARARRALAAALAIAAVAVLAACGSGGSSSSGSGSGSGSGTSSSGSTTTSSSDSGAGKKISVALSNYYTGNNWRKEMVASFINEAKKGQAAGKISKYTVADSNGSVPQQISQIQSMILQGYNAIVIDASSPTGLNGVIAKACSAGVIVVVFDSLATAPCAYKVATDYVKYGEIETQFVADQFKGQPVNTLVVRGIAGVTVDTDIYQGMKNVMAKNPNMKEVGHVFGQWTESVAQQAVQRILPSLPKVHAILTEGNDGGGPLKAVQQAGIKPIPLVIQGNTGQDLQEWKKVTDKDPSYKTFSISSYPSMSSVAMWEAYMIANGKKVPKLVYVPLLTIPEENREAWLKVLSFAEIANNDLNEQDTAEIVANNAAGKPEFVSAPLPTGR
jgi:ribose transport system substrate-binding protein